jgi:hypothetical protein
MELINLLLSIGGLLSSTVDKLKKGGQEKRDRLATFFDKISDNLETTAKIMREGGEPIRECRELSSYLEDLAEIIGRRIDQKEVAKLTEYLQQANDSPMGISGYKLRHDLMPEADSPKDLKIRANQVDEVAGIFRATANKIRAKA